MKIKLKLNGGRVPTKAHATDAGYDLYATSKTYDDYGNIVYGTSINIDIPVGYTGLIYPRSSISKIPLALANSVGVIDPGYTGEIIIKFKPTPYRMTGSDQFENSATEYGIGDRVAQLIITKSENIHFEVTEHLDNSERSSNGFGSSDKNVKNV